MSSDDDMDIECSRCNGWGKDENDIECSKCNGHGRINRPLIPN